MRARIFCAGLIVALLFLSGIRAQPTVAVDADAQENALQDRYRQQLELLKALAEEHCYKLGHGEPFKYIKDPQNEERTELRRLMQSSLPAEGPAPKTTLDSSTPFTHVLHALPDGRIVSSSLSEGVTTLGDVFDRVLKLKRQEFECPPNLLFTYMAGDWLLLEDRTKRAVMSDAAAATLETIFDEQLNLPVTVKWKIEKRPALVLRGEYKAVPANPEQVSGDLAKRVDGMFLIPVSREGPSMHAGPYEEFLQVIGEALMLPVVDEASKRPRKRDMFCQVEGRTVTGYSRLKPEHEQSVLESLHEQLGYDLSIEPREVRLLSIEPTAE